MTLNYFPSNSDNYHPLLIASSTIANMDYIPMVSMYSSKDSNSSLSFGLYEGEPFSSIRKAAIFDLIMCKYNNIDSAYTKRLVKMYCTYQIRDTDNGIYYAKSGRLVYKSKLGEYKILLDICIRRKLLQGILLEYRYTPSRISFKSESLSIILSKELVNKPEYRYMFRNINRIIKQDYIGAEILVVEDVINTVYPIKVSSPTGRTISELIDNTSFGNNYYFLIGEKKREKERLEAEERRRLLNINIKKQTIRDIDNYLLSMENIKQQIEECTRQQIVLVDDTDETNISESPILDEYIERRISQLKDDIWYIQTQVRNLIREVQYPQSRYLEVENGEPHVVHYSIRGQVSESRITPVLLNDRYFVIMPEETDIMYPSISNTLLNSVDVLSDTSYTVGIDPYRTDGATSSQGAGILSQVQNTTVYNPSELSTETVHNALDGIIAEYRADRLIVPERDLPFFGDIPDDPALT